MHVGKKAKLTIPMIDDNAVTANCPHRVWQLFEQFDVNHSKTRIIGHIAPAISHHSIGGCQNLSSPTIEVLDRLAIGLD